MTRRASGTQGAADEGLRQKDRQRHYGFMADKALGRVPMCVQLNKIIQSSTQFPFNFNKFIGANDDFSIV
ncbi:MAG: hypothetical protein FWC89_09420 [Defluviitaleaceae bacterium]|nr:hypothetical protein [Defluviitaleaceae bacterium]